jgi:hypothetical protein
MKISNQWRTSMGMLGSNNANLFSMTRVREWGDRLLPDVMKHKFRQIL